MLPMKAATSATDTSNTNATRFAVGTEGPMMRASRIAAGIPWSVLRRSARFTDWIRTRRFRTSGRWTRWWTKPSR